jgi:hypothetical protein
VHAREHAVEEACTNLVQLGRPTTSNLFFYFFKCSHLVRSSVPCGLG